MLRWMRLHKELTTLFLFLAVLGCVLAFSVSIEEMLVASFLFYVILVCVWLIVDLIWGHSPFLPALGFSLAVSLIILSPLFGGYLPFALLLR